MVGKSLISSLISDKDALDFLFRFLKKIVVSMVFNFVSVKS